MSEIFYEIYQSFRKRIHAEEMLNNTNELLEPGVIPNTHKKQHSTQNSAQFFFFFSFFYSLFIAKLCTY